jgi:flagellar motility protein MotE (MotC chaperone)
MTRWVRDFRLIPIVLVAVVSLLALKSLGLVFDGGYTLGQRLGGSDTLVVTTVPVPPTVQLQSPTSPLELATAQPSGAKSWMQEIFNYPDITGSVAASKPENKPADKPADKLAPGKAAGQGAAAQKGPPAVQKAATTPAADGTVVPMDRPRPASAAERALLGRLHERRQQLDARARELDVRESLIKAAEKKIETRNTAQKADDAKDGPPGQRKDDNPRLKAVVTIYETMKPKEAARIFDRLDIKVLLDVARQINPRRMSEILAQMTPEAAERLTVELASGGAGTGKAADPSSLPKIEGRPGGG